MIHGYFNQLLRIENLLSDCKISILIPAFNNVLSLERIKRIDDRISNNAGTLWICSKNKKY